MQLALERCPKSDDAVVEARRAIKREIFCQGYAAAKNTLALTWKDIAILITIYEHEVEAGNISRYEDEGTPSLQEASEIILRQFNEIRKK